MSQIYLKIKIMSLAAEAKIIRKEEQRWYGASELRTSLRSHRVHDVRSEARVALLAYGYLRGRAYATLESRPLSAPSWERVAGLVKKYGSVTKVEKKELEAWAQGDTALKVAA